ncbi:hypothetical protein HXX76_005951 [Chlamydomonas incerta]|uniref:Methyltransferase type 11 domain-containing protein n=1 Tax=Chlamydomonas incerta TaxID=51695 RepID=A0A835W4S3_CHLIN|nr:hypothetical protein HXX76_005951 [Chlamydomonas incerta]|eukprot:KAG2437293.1 hypothetical protein HXX76_005951 [Chlamydomonas incerta]
MSSKSRAALLSTPAAAPSGAAPSAGSAAPPAAASSASNAALSRLLSRRHGHGARNSSSSGVVASAAAPASYDAPSTSGQAAAGEQFGFVCPICQQTRFNLASMPNRSEGLYCNRCVRTFPASPAYLDLTLTAGIKQKVYNQRSWGGTELFRSPLISFVYERGWRQGFAWAGFPGADAEYDIAMRYLLPAAGGKVLVDMSCGSGLFSRRFASSGAFSGVIAADFSESMLQQTREYCMQEGGGLNGSTPIMLLRADVARLPFATGSIAAIHAGAAIHCWPNPQAALAEISRVLAPGGVFVASTFLTASAPLGQVFGDDLVRPLSQLDPTNIGGITNSTYKWWEEQELRDLCEAVGLVNFQRERSMRFILISAQKPQPAVPLDSAEFEE